MPTQRVHYLHRTWLQVHTHSWQISMGRSLLLLLLLSCGSSSLGQSVQTFEHDGRTFLFNVGATYCVECGQGYNAPQEGTGTCIPCEPGMPLFKPFSSFIQVNPNLFRNRDIYLCHGLDAVPALPRWLRESMVRCNHLSGMPTTPLQQRE